LIIEPFGVTGRGLYASIISLDGRIAVEGELP
jgi:hypothetical protein